jgi:hypothetical protein
MDFVSLGEASAFGRLQMLLPLIVYCDTIQPMEREMRLIILASMLASILSPAPVAAEGLSYTGEPVAIGKGLSDPLNPHVKDPCHTRNPPDYCEPKIPGIKSPIDK